jgi:hypothetical protein
MDSLREVNTCAFNIFEIKAMARQMFMQAGTHLHLFSCSSIAMPLTGVQALVQIKVMAFLSHCF